ncbi:hypothetical protein QR680_015422 [Steinernema hermaphroditum]|uniref:Uncharacterized protein n=1 Tax=Steinernema hermaphroditum TaxID=289476 RepID=A0AA39LKT3_9BILA|nr:hypothetical protein QR680_015422 [Steinernema hermaphroditum]
MEMNGQYVGETWGALHKYYKKNVKGRKPQTGDGADASAKIHWKFSEDLAFLDESRSAIERPRLLLSQGSVSSYEYASHIDATNEGIGDDPLDFEGPSSPQIGWNSSLPTVVQRTSCRVLKICRS